MNVIDAGPETPICYVPETVMLIASFATHVVKTVNYIIIIFIGGGMEPPHVSGLYLEQDISACVCL